MVAIVHKEDVGKKSGYNIMIRFNEWSRDRIVGGKKLATTRTKRHGSIGDRFQIADYWFELTSIKRLMLGEVAEKFYAVEGAESPEEFKSVWVGIHPRARWTPFKIVFIHFFKPVECGYDVGRMMRIDDVLEK